MRREFGTRKPCEPFCTISCVHRVAIIDMVKTRPFEALDHLFPANRGERRRLPAGVRVLKWLFLQPEPTGARRVLRAVALRAFGLR
jgi:hypothetical protein